MSYLSWADEQAQRLADDYGEAMRLMREQLTGGDRMQRDFWTPRTAPEGDEPVVEPPTEDEA